jgi:hypothetical protein
MFQRLAAWLIRRALRRPPDVVIGGKDHPYMLRWWVWPRNRVCNLYLHRFLRSDDDRALHDHPWINVSIPLAVENEHPIGDRHLVFYRGHPVYDEIVPLPPGDFQHIGDPPGHRRFVRRIGDIVFRRPTSAHRIALRQNYHNGPEVTVWSLFFTGPNVRTWGFLCPNGWRSWKVFTANVRNADGQIVSNVGRGCE